MTVTSSERTSFEAAVLSGAGCEDVATTVAKIREGDGDAARAVAAVAFHVAAVAPERLVEVYAALCEGWLGRRPSAAEVSSDGSEAGNLPPQIFSSLWEMVDDNELGKDPTDLTVRTAALAGLLPPELHRRVGAMAVAYPGVPEAVASGLPEKFQLADLERCPQDSLGGMLHSLVVNDGFDLEVLDRDNLGLRMLPSPLDYLNIRILQCHDVWHTVAGYETTGLHEIAISGFQMGQFGHHYSSTFLALVLTKPAFTQNTNVVGFMLDTILSAYIHGRETPPMLGVVWEEIWNQPLDNVRSITGIDAYTSPYEPALLETMRSGAA